MIATVREHATLGLSVGFLVLAVVLGFSVGESGSRSSHTQRAVLDSLCSGVLKGSEGAMRLSAVHEHAIEAAERHFIDPNLVLAVIAAESRCKSKARSGAGALGLMQLMPGTAKDMGVSNPLSERENVIGGTKYLAYLLERFSSIEHALAAYNAGPAKVRRYGGIPPYRETKQYVRRVMKFYRLFSGKRRSESSLEA